MSLNTSSDCKTIADRYYLHDVIAQTSHSRIFLATDLALNYRKCVIKQLYPSFCPTNMLAKIESSFLQEVAISKEIAGQHFQLCKFYKYFVESGRHYLVQEWIEGVNLQEKLWQNSPLSEFETKKILGNILLVVDRIHNLGIVHNDLKPSNIILRSPDNLPVLIDFGVARRVNGEYGQNVISGTPGYMSLEQAMGKSLFANDIYALGMTAIHLLTGKSPQMIDFNNQQDNFWQQVKTSFDPKLVAIIDRAISSKPQQRFNSAREMLAVWHNSYNIFIFTSQNRNIIFSKLENIGLIFILLISGTWLYLTYQISLLNRKPLVKMADLQPSESFVVELPKEKLKPKIVKTTNDSLKKIIFIPGTSAATVKQHLGEPLWRKSGFWENSIAWSYEDVVIKGIDLGYIFDSRTHRLRQVEIAVPPTTDFSTLELALNSFLADKNIDSDIKKGLTFVYQRQQNTYSFATNNLQGIIQRNDRDRIYIGVWEADFH